MKYAFLIALMMLSACAEVDAPKLSEVPQVPEQHHLPEETQEDAITTDEIAEIIRKREELLNTGE